MKATKLKFIIPAFAIFIALIFLMAPIGAASHSISPATITSTNYQPNPTLNTQATWSTFNSSMAYNQYINATGGKAYLNVQNGTGNYISVNPGDIQSKYLQGDNITTLGAWDSTAWTLSSNGGLQTTIGKSGTSEYITATENSTAAGNVVGSYIIPLSDLISNSPTFNYLTVQYKFTGDAQTGTDAKMCIFNGTDGTASNSVGIIYPGQSGYFTLNLAQIQKMGKGTFNITGSGAMKELEIAPTINEQAGTNTYNLSILGMALTTYPIMLGYNATGAPVTQAYGNGYMSVFKPAVPMNIINSGYTENLTQSMSLTNYTTTQTPITSGSYIEQVGYQATFSLPSSPDLSYSASNFSLPLSVPASQFQVLDVNGVSYLSSLGNKTNGTAVLLSSVNPTTPITYLAYVDYTATQWQSISHPAGIFTYDGIAYYYFIAIGVVAALIGLGVAAKRANTTAKQIEKVDHTPRRGR